MPGLPAAIFAWVSALSAATIVKAIITTALIVNGVQQAKRAKRKAREAWEASLSDRTLTIRSAVAARTIVYGRARVGVVFIRKPIMSGDYSEFMHLQFALAGHEIDAIEDIWFGDESIGPLDANGYVTGGKYYRGGSEPAGDSAYVPGSRQITLTYAPSSIQSVALSLGDGVYDYIPSGSITVAGNVITLPATWNGALTEGRYATVTYTRSTGAAYVRVKKFLGTTAGERDTELEALAPGIWKATHLGKGVPRLHITIQYDDALFPSGLPEITAIVRGKRLYDPRTSTTAWSMNSSLCSRDYIVDPLGLGETPGYVNAARAIASANVCDEAVSLGDLTQPRYTCNGVLSTADNRLENLGAIATSMAGSAVYSGGEWHINAGAYSAPVMDLTDDDLADGPIELVTETPTRDIFNAVRGKIIDPLRGYQEVEFAPYVSPVYVAEDGGETIFQDIVLPLTDDIFRAQRLAKLILHLSRQSVGLSAWFKDAAARLQPGDTVRLSVGIFGQELKTYRVKDRRFTFPGRVQLLLQETAAAIYSWSYTEAIGYDPTPNTTLPDPSVVAPITGLTVTSGPTKYRVMMDGSRQAIMTIAWDASTDIAVRSSGAIIVLVKRAIDTQYERIRLDGDATSVDYDVANGEAYNLIVYASNGLAEGDAEFTTHQVTGAPVNTPASASITLDRFAALALSGMSITPDPGFEDLTAWSINGTITRQLVTWNRFGRYAMRADSASAYLYTKRVPIDAARRYRATVIMNATAGSNRLAYLICIFYDANGNVITGSSDPAGWPASGTYHYFGLVGQEPPENALTEYSVAFGGGEAAGIPSSAKFVSIGALLNYDDGAARTGQNWLCHARIQQMQDTALLGTSSGTEVSFSINAGGSMAAGPGALGEYLCYVNVTNSSDRDAVISASAQGYLRVYYGSVDSPSYCTALLAAGSMKTPLFGGSVRVAECTSGSAGSSFSLENYGVLAAGQSTQVYVLASRFNRRNSGPTEYAQMDYGSCTLRVELIKI